VWEQHFGIGAIGLDDDFFELGGNSLLAARLLRAVQDLTGCALPLSALVQAPTVARLAALIEERGPLPSPTVVRMRAGTGRPLFLVHGLSGTVMECWTVVRSLRSERPVWGLQAHGLDGKEPPHRTVEAMAAAYLADLRAVQGAGPYSLSGFSFGGLVAYEMACWLVQQGERVEQLVLLDPYVPPELDWLSRAAERVQHAAQRFKRMSAVQARAYLQRRLIHAVLQAQARLGLGQPPRPSRGLGMPQAQEGVYDACSEALLRYRPQPYDGPVTFVHARDLLPGYLDPMPAWRHAIGSGLRVVEIPGEHLQLVSTHAAEVARAIDDALSPAVGI
jgi:acetoacetyl-CoA synthetase